MNTSWDKTGIAYDVALWREVLRVLKPGGFLLAFSSCRTYHRMACAVEDAGFTIHPLVGMLGWIQGQGFPKGRNVGKELDRRAGIKREVVGVDPARSGRLVNQKGEYTTAAGWSAGHRTDEITSPATDEAKRWDGWSYGLQAIKPSIEPVLVATKPYENGKALDSILKHGVGAYNVGACRVRVDPVVDASQIRTMNRGVRPSGGGWGLNDHEPDKPQVVSSCGRVPSNVLLVHTPGCRKVGVQQVKNTSGSVSGDEPSYTGQGVAYGDFDRVPFDRHGGPEGIEMVDQYECVEGCPVAALAHQSGHSRTTRIEKPSDCRGNTWGGTIQQHCGARGYSDEGTAARFFSQFEVDGPPFFYCGKSPFREKEAGLLGVLRCPVCGGLATTKHLDQGGVEQKCRRNTHPTVKPISLMRWLIRLVTRGDYDQLVVDPFCGSGSTGVAVMLEQGRRFIGIDQDAQSIAIAEARIRYWAGTVENDLLDGVE